MNNDYTHITFILDRSGSMAGAMWNDAMGGLKSIIEEQKKDKSLCTFSLCFFDTIIETPIKLTNIQELSAQSIDDLKIHPRGMTALLDALGFSIKDAGEAFDKMAESERPAKVIFMVQTDGQENASREYNSQQIKELIEEQEKKYNWKFMFLSSDINATQDTAQYGFAACSAINFAEDKTTGAYDVISSKLSSARAAKTADAYIQATSFNDQDKEQLK